MQTMGSNKLLMLKQFQCLHIQRETNYFQSILLVVNFQIQIVFPINNDLYISKNNSL